MAQKRLRGDGITIRLVNNGGVQETMWNATGSMSVESTNAILES